MNSLIITGIFPPDIGGPATYVPQIAEALSGRGHQITVVALSDRLDHEDTAYPFRVIRLPRKEFKLWRWLHTVVKLIQLGRKADLLFVNGLAMEAALANLVLRKPMVQKVVGDLAWERATNLGWVKDNFEEFQKKRYGLKVEVLKALRGWWTRRADRVIVPSQYLARWVAHWGVPEERIVVIYNAVELVDNVKPLPIPLKTPVKAVTVGRLIPLKRIDQLVEVLIQIPELSLVVIGEGPEQERLEALAKRLGVSERVYFARSRSKAETYGLMVACDFFVLNSIHEGLPHAVLEAMALGLPVVATAVGGIPEVVKDGETGILVPPEGDGLIEALRWLVEDPEGRKAMAHAGQDWVKKRFSIAQMINQTETLLVKILAQGGQNGQIDALRKP